MFVVVISMMITACTIWEPSQCPNGKQCPPGTRCAASQDICIRTGCGDGRAEDREGEECDDGNTEPGDGCSADCHSNEVCGNLIVDHAAAEMCDDGNKDAGDGCSSKCLSEYCGNGITDTAQGEVCDDGNEVSGDGCSADCGSTETCGNGFTDTAAGEVCDDGNEVSGDGCSADCDSMENCGNGITDTAVGEVCDDGDSDSGDGCSSDCLSDEVCGNGIRDTAIGEVCDDGNRDSGDDCSSDCRSDETCRNGIVDAPDEECDCGAGAVAPGPPCDGRQNSDTGGYCNTDCQKNCGDGELDDNEECDGTPVTHEFCTDHGFDMGLLGCDDCRVTTESCQKLGWNEMDSPTESTLRDVWGDPSGDPILAVGDDGVVIRFDGSSWADETSLASRLKGISGTGPNDIWVVGDDGALPTPAGKVFHYNGSQWSDVHEGDQPPTTLPPLRSVWSHLSNVVFAVGGAGTIRHFNGSAWTPNICQFGGRLSDVWGSSQNNVVAVSVDGEICHYDGMSWDRVLESPVSFHSVWGRYAVGAAGIIYTRNDGSSWRRVEETPTNKNLYGVWVAPQGDTFAVGSEGTILENTGSTWFDVPVVARDFFGVWGSHRNNVFAVGAGGQIWHRGATWTPIPLSESVPHAVLNDGLIHPSSANSFYTVGNGGVILLNGVRQFDEVNNPITVNLHGIWGGARGLYAVGDGGKIYRESSYVWREMQTPIAASLKGIWGSESDIFVVGAAGTILRATGGSEAWSTMPSGTTLLLNSVWGSSASNVFAVGDEGTILRFDGNSWTSFPSPTTDHLRSVWVSDAGDVFVLSGGTASQASRIWHRVESEWRLMPIPQDTEGLQKLRGTAPDDIFAVGTSGQVWHYDGVAWAPIATRTFSNFRGLWVTSEKVLVVGDSSYELATAPR
jgi:cysteine-rich repeat protein